MGPDYAEKQQPLEWPKKKKSTLDNLEYLSLSDFALDLEPNRILFDSKSIRKLQLLSKFGLN